MRTDNLQKLVAIFERLAKLGYTPESINSVVEHGDIRLARLRRRPK